jgi:hypothetical protein
MIAISVIFLFRGALAFAAIPISRTIQPMSEQ